MEQPLHRNGSGYFDKTAFEAMSNVIKEGRTMDRTGEIWEYETNKGDVKMAVIVADHGNVCNTLACMDKPCEDSIEVNCMGIKYVNPQMLQYTFDYWLAGFVRKLTADEFTNIKSAVADALGMNCETKVVEKVVEVPTAEKDDATLATIAEGKIYREMYFDILDRLTKMGAKA